MSTREATLRVSWGDAIFQRLVLRTANYVAFQAPFSNAQQAVPEATDVIGTIDVPASELRANHPLIPLFGRFQDDPTWERFMENIKDYRRAVQELENEVE